MRTASPLLSHFIFYNHPKPYDGTKGSSTSRLLHLDSTAGPGPRAGRLGHRRSDYLELLDVDAVTAVPDMTAVRAVSPVRAVRAAPLRPRAGRAGPVPVVTVTSVTR